MTSTTPNPSSGDCQQQQQQQQQQQNQQGSDGLNGNDPSGAAAAAVSAAALAASKNAFLEGLQQHHAAGMAGHMAAAAAAANSPYGMGATVGASVRSSGHPGGPYQQMQQSAGGYPFSHMTPQNSYAAAAAAAAAAAGYHHLSPYPNQCPSPPRDGN